MVLARFEGEGCIVIRRRPITQSKAFILKPISPTRPPSAQHATRDDIPQKCESLGDEHDTEGRPVAGWRVPPSG